MSSAVDPAVVIPASMEVQRCVRTVFADLVGCVPRRRTCRDVSNRRRSYTAVSDQRLGEGQRECGLQKRTVWLPRPGIAGMNSRRAFPQKDGSTPSNNFKPFGWQQNTTQN